MASGGERGIRVQGLAARYGGWQYGRLALRDVSFQVAASERLLLLGPNGAGKSTLIRVLAGLMAPSAGQVALNGMRPAEARGQIGVIGHATYLYGELTVRENLRLYADLYGVRDHARAEQLLGQVGLTRLADEPVQRLSRGQQQRATLARALMHDPPILLLDEPDTGLDVGAFEILSNLLASSPRAVLMTTHNVAIGYRLATHVAILNEGRLAMPPCPVSATSPAQLADELEQAANASARLVAAR